MAQRPLGGVAGAAAVTGGHAAVQPSASQWQSHHLQYSPSVFGTHSGQAQASRQYTAVHHRYSGDNPGLLNAPPTGPGPPAQSSTKKPISRPSPPAVLHSAAAIPPSAHEAPTESKVSAGSSTASANATADVSEDGGGQQSLPRRRVSTCHGIPRAKLIQAPDGSYDGAMLDPKDGTYWVYRTSSVGRELQEKALNASVSGSAVKTATDARHRSQASVSKQPPTALDTSRPEQHVPVTSMSGQYPGSTKAPGIHIHSVDPKSMTQKEANSLQELHKRYVDHPRGR